MCVNTHMHICTCAPHQGCAGTGKILSKYTNTTHGDRKGSLTRHIWWQLSGATDVQMPARKDAASHRKRLIVS